MWGVASSMAGPMSTGRNLARLRTTPRRRSTKRPPRRRTQTPAGNLPSLFEPASFGRLPRLACPCPLLHRGAGPKWPDPVLCLKLDPSGGLRWVASHMCASQGKSPRGRRWGLTSCYSRACPGRSRATLVLQPELNFPPTLLRHVHKDIMWSQAFQVKRLSPHDYLV